MVVPISKWDIIVRTLKIADVRAVSKKNSALKNCCLCLYHRTLKEKAATSAAVFEMQERKTAF
jgi:hypothetical protein